MYDDANLRAMGLSPTEDRELDRLQEGMGALFPKRVRRAENKSMERVRQACQGLTDLRVEVETLIASRKTETEETP